MSHTLITITHPSAKVSQIALNRQDKRNALNVPMLEELYSALKSLEQDKRKRVLILHGNGPVFCAGLDLKSVSDADNLERSSHLLADVLTTLNTSHLVTIAAVHGAAIAGGAGLMGACDFAFAAEGTKVGFPEVKRGLVAAQVATLIRRQVSWRSLYELFLLGDFIDAIRAKDIGLINGIFPVENLMAEALACAEKVCEGSPEAIWATKELLNALCPKPLAEELDIALAFHKKARASLDAQEGVNAFFEKRKPSWLL